MIGKKLDALLVRMDSVLACLKLMRDDAEKFRDDAKIRGGIVYNNDVSTMMCNVPTYEEVKKTIAQDIAFNNWFQGLSDFDKALYSFVEDNMSGSNVEKKRKTEELIGIIERFK